ncbi:kinase-like protein [Punctularia strigosozonata HHB-11173 SS5]|uniref:kinase-like protein n=1 Tax=Punctularia strigosozonata (strain HHB-11173) TaxID=741275 RepID=UPI0004417CCF|nr:kinase-like protein [Punctularia strigosozonata HHB-11173 SS5]EIN12457.1 kinase-like protein [Punctularia strigosozonata HHB-11173 SS5]
MSTSYSKLSRDVTNPVGPNRIDFDEATWALLVQAHIPEDPAVRLFPSDRSVNTSNDVALVNYLYDALTVVSSGERHNGAARKAISQLLVRLVQQTNVLPSKLFVAGVQLHSRDPVNAGGFADILRGSYYGQEVALKRFRIYAHSQERSAIHKRLCREVLLWQALDHPNVLPFIGVDASTFDFMICAVSPWMHGGSLLDYRTRMNPSPLDINTLLLQAALGMDYLHCLSVVHGDLRCGIQSNILVDRKGHAKLADFGLSVIMAGEKVTPTTSNGSYRWNAPELLATGDVHRTLHSDVYAFGCVCLEAHTGLPPFAEIRNEYNVVARVMAGARPHRPKSIRGRPISKLLWTLVERCWDIVPDVRPTSRNVVEELRCISAPSVQLPIEVPVPTHSLVVSSSGSSAVRPTFVAIVSALQHRLKQLDGVNEAVAVHRFISQMQLNGPHHVDTSFDELATIIAEFSGRLRSLRSCDVTRETLDAVIALLRDMLHHYTNMNKNKAPIVHELGLCLKNRYERLLRRQNLDEAIVCLRAALKLHALHDPHSDDTLVDLADTLWLRYGHRNSPIDLDECIAYYRIAVAGEPAYNRKQASLHTRLADAYRERHKRYGDVKALKQAILHYTHAAACGETSADVIEKSGLVLQLASSLRKSFKRVGNVADLDEALAYFRVLVGLGSERRPDCARSFHDLVFCLSRRGLRDGDPTALKLAALFDFPSPAGDEPRGPGRDLA